MNGVFKEKFTWCKSQVIKKVHIPSALLILSLFSLWFMYENYPETASDFLLISWVLIGIEVVNQLVSRHVKTGLSKILTRVIVLTVILLTLFSLMMIVLTPSEQKSYMMKYPTYNMAPKILPA